MPWSGGRRSQPQGSTRSSARQFPPAGSTWPTPRGSAAASPRPGPSEPTAHSATPAEQQTPQARAEATATGPRTPSRPVVSPVSHPLAAPVNGSRLSPDHAADGCATSSTTQSPNAGFPARSGRRPAARALGPVQDVPDVVDLAGHAQAMEGGIGVESAGFVPPGFSAGDAAYLADRFLQGQPASGHGQHLAPAGPGADQRSVP